MTGTTGRRDHEYIFTPIVGDDGVIVAVSGTRRGLTERKRAEEKLKANDRRKDELLTMLPHELSNSLAAVENAVTELRMYGDAENADCARAVIERPTRYLSRLIDDLLDVSRITSGKTRLRKELIVACTILEWAVEAVRPLIEEREHRLFTAIDRGNLALEADPTRLEQVVVNLLTNAAK